MSWLQDFEKNFDEERAQEWRERKAEQDYKNRKDEAVKVLEEDKARIAPIIEQLINDLQKHLGCMCFRPTTWRMYPGGSGDYYVEKEEHFYNSSEDFGYSYLSLV